MNPLLFVGLTLAASAVAHGSVLFLEPDKASMFKAVAVNLLLVSVSNLAQWSDLQASPVLEWMLYIGITTVCVRALYKLKPMNSVTVGSCYVACSYVLANLAAF